MSAGNNKIAGGRFVLAWDYDNGTDILDVYIVPSNPARHVFHGKVEKTVDGDVGGYTELTHDSAKAQAIVSSLVGDGSLPATYTTDANDAARALRRKRRLARIAELEIEAAELKVVTD